MRHRAIRRNGAIAVLLALAPALAGCVGGTERTSPVGTWIGRLQTTAGHCPTDQDTDLTVTATQISFVPGDGVLTLVGRRDPGSDTLHAQLLLSDMNHKPLPMVFDGTFSDGAITGAYGTPTCHATIALHRPTHTALQRVLGD